MGQNLGLKILFGKFKTQLCFDHKQKKTASKPEKRRTMSPLNEIIKHLGKTIPMQSSILIALYTVEQWQQLQAPCSMVSNIKY